MAELSLMNDDTKNKLRTLYLEGKTIKEILAILEIPKGTFDMYYYTNKYALRDFMTECKKERVMQTVERFSDELMAIDADQNAKMKAIQQKESEFLRETLLKEQGYTKRIETIGFNVNKTEPLDDKQKQALDKLLKVSGNKVKTVDYDVVIDQETIDTPENTTTPQL